MWCLSSGEWYRPILALFAFHVYVRHINCGITNTIYSNESYFKRFSSNKVLLWSWVAIDHNHVAFSLILMQGAYINSLFLKKNERNFTLIFIYYLEDIIPFKKIPKKMHFIYWVFLIFGQKCHFRGIFLLSSFGWCIYKMTSWKHILLRKLNILHEN